MERTGIVCEAYDLLEAHDELERLEDRGGTDWASDSRGQAVLASVLEEDVEL
jgi:hypothetical protein